jgi:hypothetical protein
MEASVFSAIPGPTAVNYDSSGYRNTADLFVGTWAQALASSWGHGTDGDDRRFWKMSVAATNVDFISYPIDMNEIIVAKDSSPRACLICWRLLRSNKLEVFTCKSVHHSESPTYMSVTLGKSMVQIIHCSSQNQHLAIEERMSKLYSEYGPNLVIARNSSISLQYW